MYGVDGSLRLCCNDLWVVSGYTCFTKGPPWDDHLQFFLTALPPTSIGCHNPLLIHRQATCGCLSIQNKNSQNPPWGNHTTASVGGFPRTCTFCVCGESG